MYRKSEKRDEMMLQQRERQSRQQIQARLKSTVTLNQQHNATGGTSEQQRNPGDQKKNKKKPFHAAEMSRLQTARSFPPVKTLT